MNDLSLQFYILHYCTYKEHETEKKRMMHLTPSVCMKNLCFVEIYFVITPNQTARSQADGKYCIQ